MRYCIFLWLSVTTTFLHADWAVNKIWNKYHHGELYPYLTKTVFSFYGIPWEKTNFVLRRNKSSDVIKPNPLKHHKVIDLTTTEALCHALIDTPYQPYAKKKGLYLTPEEEQADFANHFIKNIKIIFRNGFYSDRKPRPYMFTLARLITGKESVPYFDFDMANRYQDAELSPTLLTVLKSIELSAVHKTLQKRFYERSKRAAEQNKQKAAQFWQKKYAQNVQNQESVTITVHDKTTQTAKQVGNTCAFHALKNASYLFEGNDAGLQDTGEDQTPFCLSKWQAIAGKNIDLEATDIKKIIYETHVLNPENITVISNVTEFAPELFVCSDQEFEIFCNQLQALCDKRPCKHAYIIGNMRHAGGGSIRLSGIFGHWIAILVNSNASNQITLECADSFNDHEAVNEEVLESFKRIILSSSDEMRMQKDLTGYIQTIVESSRDSKLRDLKTLMTVAYEKNYTTNHYFMMVYIPQIIEALNGIVENNSSIIATPHPLTDDDIIDIIIICTQIAHIKHEKNDIMNFEKYPALNALLSNHIDNNDKCNLLNRYIKRL